MVLKPEQPHSGLGSATFIIQIRTFQNPATSRHPISDRTPEFASRPYLATVINQQSSQTHAMVGTQKKIKMRLITA